MTDFIKADAGRAFIAATLHDASEVHMAWGNGDPSWSAGPPAVDGTETALFAEVGRRRATEVFYAVQDAEGEFDLEQFGTFSRSPSNAPTGFVLCRFEFALPDGLGEDIKELGVFVNTVLDGATPPGKDYIVPAEYTDPGIAFAVARLVPLAQFTVTGLKRESWFYIYTA